MLTTNGQTRRAGTGFRYGNPVIQCDGAQVHLQCRQLATVMSVTGCVDGTTVDRLVECSRHSVIPERDFVLDLTGVTAFTAAGPALLDGVESYCAAAGVQWTLAADDAIAAAVRHHTGEPEMPVFGTVADAVHHISDTAGARRRLLPLLTKTA